MKNFLAGFILGGLIVGLFGIVVFGDWIFRDPPKSTEVAISVSTPTALPPTPTPPPDPCSTERGFEIYRGGDFQGWTEKNTGMPVFQWVLDTAPNFQKVRLEKGGISGQTVEAVFCTDFSGDVYVSLGEIEETGVDSKNWQKFLWVAFAAFLIIAIFIGFRVWG
jgi:hypothetical protein